ncbi:multidrug ABC transporter ATPase [Clostridiales bacterium PH28_bin88]|nr:multidrug ABC transporter ATPase [Clostridiales bacterium PH28_bin88]
MIIETHDLTKMYGQQVGCQEICLSVAEGQIFGFLGPNGAGKSTLVKMLVGLLRPTSGQAWLVGKPLGNLEARRNIGFLPENFRYHDWLTGNELLSFHASLYGMGPDETRRRIPEVLEMVNLRGVEKKRVGAFSKGMQQRIGIACALLPDPRLLFLDEPTSALDPLGRREVREILLRLRDAGKTVFLNSHLLGEVEAVCQDVAFIKQGRVVISGRMGDLLGGSIEVEMRVGGLTPAMEEELRRCCRALSVEGAKLVAVVGEQEDVPKLARVITYYGGLLYELTPRRTSLEELFVNLIGEGEAVC